ncbi:MAG: helicase C-terminal domain-containing protein [Phycisphaerales bacterium]
MPELSLEEMQVREFVKRLVRKAGRALYLTPDDRQAKIAKDQLADLSDVEIVSASELESSKESFVAKDRAVAIVANRYDGIDLHEDECRLLIFDGFPSGTNLQERFLTSRMGARALLDDRVLTRIVQGFGRCTRSATDYSIVVVLGDDLQAYLARTGNRALFHPEMQAELEFGLEQSRNNSIGEMWELAELFWQQAKEWQVADQAIIDIRSDLERQELPYANELMSAVKSEIDYQQCAWHGDHLRALECCRKVLGSIVSAELRGYRALWLYLAGTSAWLAHVNGQLAQGDAIASGYFEEARSAAKGLRFLVGLVPSETDDGVGEGADAVMQLVERIESKLLSLGTTHDRKFNSTEKQIRELLWQTKDGKKFEHGHELLGGLIGYVAGNGKGDGEPDPWWIVDSGFCFVFEDNAEGNPESALSVTKARQAATHQSWIRSKNLVEPSGEIVSVLVTPKVRADPAAIPHLGSVRYWHLSDFLRWADEALQMIRRLRRDLHGEGDLSWRANAASELKRCSVSPAELDTMLKVAAAEAMAGD